MGISRYLAMTAAEMEAFSPPEGWTAACMACHFSPYGTGLSNIPSALPSGAMLILNDRTPFHGHDPERITGQLLEALDRLHFGSLLVDFERPDVDAYHKLCQMLTQRLPCPVGVSMLYAEELDCPVFLPPVPLDQPLEEYISPWKGRALWLDVAPDAACVTVTEEGSTLMPLPFSPPPSDAFTEETLHCRYRTEILPDKINFYLWRNWESLIQEADSLGVTKCIGLYQELCNDK